MGVAALYIERGQVAAAVTGADQWGSLGSMATDAVVRWKARPRSRLQMERGFKTQERPSTVKEDFKVTRLCLTRRASGGQTCSLKPAGKPTAVADAFLPIVLCRL